MKRSTIHQDFSISAVTAGFLAVLISYSGPLIIFFQAAQSAEVSTALMTSWVWAISVGAALSGILLSWWLKVPVVTAWSAPGTALLVTLFPELSLNQAVGAYLTAGVAIFLIGISGWFDRIVQAIPKGIACAMMAGILFQFGVGAFKAVESMPALALGMIAAYLVLGCFAGTVLALFATLPKELIATLAGLALFPSIATSLTAAVSDASDRDAALVTFIVCASGMSLFGLGAAFWSLLFGVATHLLLRTRRARTAVPAGRALR